MPKKLSTHKSIQRVCCPKCKRRLWCLDSPKHFLSYTGVPDVQQNITGARQKTLFLLAECDNIDTNSWLEEFICGKHGKLRVRVTRQSGGTLGANPSSSDLTHFASYQTVMEDFTHFKGTGSVFQITNPCLPISEEPVS